jgi:hypothetical protein
MSNSEPQTKRLVEVAAYLKANASECSDAWLLMMKFISRLPPDVWWAEAQYQLAEYTLTSTGDDAIPLFTRLIAEPVTPELLRAKAVILRAAWCEPGFDWAVSELAIAVAFCSQEDDDLDRLGLKTLCFALIGKDDLLARSYVERLIATAEKRFSGKSEQYCWALHDLALFEYRIGNLAGSRAANSEAIELAALLPNTPKHRGLPGHFLKTAAKWEQSQSKQT